MRVCSPQYRTARVNKEGRCRGDRENEEDTGKVLLYYLQSLYYQTVSDQRAQFNEAVFLVFSHPLFASPQMPPLPFLPPSSFISLFFSLSLCVYLPFSYLFTSVSSFDGSLRFLLTLGSPGSPSLCLPISPPGGLSHGGRHRERRFRLRVCRGNTAV